MSDRKALTRLQAAKFIRQGEENLEIIIQDPPNGKPVRVLVWKDRKKILVIVGNGRWAIRLNWKQCLGLIRRNYVRSHKG